MLEKKDLLFSEKFTNCLNEIDDSKTNYTFPISITDGVNLTIYYKEAPKITVTTEEINNN